MAPFQWMEVAAFVGSILFNDLDGNKKPDLVVLENTGSNPVSILENITEEQELAFGGKLIFSLAGGSYSRLRIADFDGDGLQDICLLKDNLLAIRRNESTPGNTQLGAVSIINLPQGGKNVEIADVDADGRPDMVLTPCSSSDVLVALNQSNNNGIRFLPP
jgi:hypothetical protein